MTNKDKETRRTLEEFPDVLTVEDLMEVLYIGRNVTYKLLRSGEIGAIHIGRMWRIPKHCVREYLAGAVSGCYTGTEGPVADAHRAGDVSGHTKEGKIIA